MRGEEEMMRVENNREGESLTRKVKEKEVMIGEKGERNEDDGKWGRVNVKV